MENTSGSSLVVVARAALALRPEVEVEDRAVRFGGELPKDAQFARLSQRFYLAARELGA